MSPAPLLPPLLYPAQTKTEQAWMNQLKKRGEIRSIGPRLYTSLDASLAKAKLENAVRSCWSDIVSRLYPETLLSHRSALEYHPTAEGVVFLTGATNREVRYPGLTLHFIRGPKKLKDDPSFLNFHASSFARALLENLSVTRASRARAFTLNELEERLEKFLQVEGEKKLNIVRDRARKIAADLKWDREFKKLDQMLGALLGTRPAAHLKSERARARAIGQPFDLSCNERLEALFADLRSQPLPTIRDSFKAPDHFTNKAFFEAYFSNYIEGTTFEIEEAERIIFERQIPKQRPKDAHDILITYQIVSDPNGMKRCPASAEELETLLRARHHTLMEARPEALPGEYKKLPNRAGDTHFVDPAYVKGTLHKGFEKYQALPAGLPRAIFIMFLVAEIHPFLDGNGRIARIMMNAELYSQRLATIIIPNVYREDYLLSLRALSRRIRTEPLIKMLVRAQRFSAFEFSPYRRTLSVLEEHNWFREPDEAVLIE